MIHPEVKKITGRTHNHKWCEEYVEYEDEKQDKAKKAETHEMGQGCKKTRAGKREPDLTKPKV